MRIIISNFKLESKKNLTIRVPRIEQNYNKMICLYHRSLTSVTSHELIKYYDNDNNIRYNFATEILREVYLGEK
jgi:hypothetical protein